VEDMKVDLTLERICFYAGRNALKQMIERVEGEGNEGESERQPYWTRLH
jgi:hypothetical protein